MNTLHISENILRLRRERGITQEELASFAGVTKASVSKWENSQSLPDVLMLPQLASFFGVSVDELLGYRPQLGQEQIRKLYRELAADFAARPFEEVMERCGGLVKQYYSCWPFLFQMVVLWMNHFMMAKEAARQQEILEEASKLCGRILENCRDVGLCSDTVFLRAGIDLQRGKVEEALGPLEESLNPYRLAGQSDVLLIQAYRLAGQGEQAERFTQISMYLHLMNLASDAILYMELHKDDLARCEETIRRLDELGRIYDMKRLNANTEAQFQLQAASVYAWNGRPAEALQRLERYVSVVRWLLEDDHLLCHDDPYFDRIADWYESCELGNQAPRGKALIKASAIQAFALPAFAPLAETAEFRRMKRTLEECAAKERQRS